MLVKTAVLHEAFRSAGGNVILQRREGLWRTVTGEKEPDSRIVFVQYNGSIN